MLTQTYHYNATIKKIVTIFGSLFNSITVGRVAENGVVSNVERCPISYGPKQKFLDRITQQPDLATDKVAVKVPRMSFEITSIQYDPEIKLNRLNRSLQPIAGDTNNYSSTWQSVPYLLGMQLNVYGRNQDDVLQIVEQILPEFQPEYTVRVKDMEYPGSITDVPIILNSVNMTDDYDGAIDRRRVIVYSLDFTIRVRFGGPQSSKGMIRFVEVGLIPKLDTSVTAGEYVHTGVSSMQDTPNSYVIITSIDTFGFNEGFVPPGVTNADASNTSVTADSIDVTADMK